MPRFRLGGKPASDTGSAALEFLAFGVPSLLTTLVVLQLLAAGYLNNLVLDAAMEGALVAGAADGSASQAEARVREVLKISAPNLKTTVDVSDTQLSGAAAVSVTISCTNNLLFFGVIPIVQTAEAISENQ